MNRIEFFFMTNIDFQQKLPINSLFLSKVLTPNQMERFVTPMEENINAKKKRESKYVYENKI